MQIKICPSLFFYFECVRWLKCFIILTYLGIVIVLCFWCTPRLNEIESSEARSILIYHSSQIFLYFVNYGKLPPSPIKRAFVPYFVHCISRWLQRNLHFSFIRNITFKMIYGVSHFFIQTIKIPAVSPSLWYIFHYLVTNGRITQLYCKIIILNILFLSDTKFKHYLLL